MSNEPDTDLVVPIKSEIAEHFPSMESCVIPPNQAGPVRERVGAANQRKMPKSADDYGNVTMRKRRLVIDPIQCKSRVFWKQRRNKAV